MAAQRIVTHDILVSLGFQGRPPCHQCLPELLTFIAGQEKQEKNKPECQGLCDTVTSTLSSMGEQSLHWRDTRLTRWNVDMLCLTFSDRFSDVFGTFFIQKPQLARERIHYSATLHKLFGPFDNFPEFVRIGMEFHCRTT